VSGSSRISQASGAGTPAGGKNAPEQQPEDERLRQRADQPASLPHEADHLPAPERGDG